MYNIYNIEQGTSLTTASLRWVQALLPSTW